MKNKRGEAKDNLDCKSIKLLLNQSNKLNLYLITCLQFVVYTRIKIRRFIFKSIRLVLRLLGIFEPCRLIISRLRKFYK